MSKTKVKIVKKVVVKQAVGKTQYLVLKRKVSPPNLPHPFWMTVTQFMNSRKEVEQFVRVEQKTDEYVGVLYEYQIYKVERVH